MRSLKTKPTKIDWITVDASPLADVPDEDSPELTADEFAELQPLFEVLFEKQQSPGNAEPSSAFNF